MPQIPHGIQEGLREKSELSPEVFTYSLKTNFLTQMTRHSSCISIYNRQTRLAYLIISAELGVAPIDFRLDQIGRDVVLQFHLTLHNCLHMKSSLL